MIDMIRTLVAATPIWQFAVIALALLLLTVFRELAWRVIATVAQLGIWIGGTLLFVAALIVTAEVLLRKGAGALLGTTFLFSGSDEISGYLFAVGTSLSLAYVLVAKGHVRIDVLYIQFGSVARAIMDLIALLVMAIFVSALLERAIDVASTSYVEQIRSNTQLRIPLAWAQIPWAFGIGLFYLAIIVALIRTIAAIAKGDWVGVNNLAGVATTEEEIEAELKGLDVRSKSQSGGA
jgi:TRAP-type mannitol/chloroaromatic compound transport system permease small subunit